MPDTVSRSRAAEVRRQAAELPEPDPAARGHSARLQSVIRDEIAAAGGRLPFDRYMDLALYAPGLGYYVAGARKFGAAGDFVTAPEISPLFAGCLATQCGEVLGALGGGDLLEFGAGSGVLAADLLRTLVDAGAAVGSYRILELSPDLRERQRATLAERVPDLLPRVRWLDRLPEGFRGVMLGNEVLDAMPVQRFRVADGVIEEGCVVVTDAELAEDWMAPRSAGLPEAVRLIEAAVGPLPHGYRSEVNLRLAPWLDAVAGSLEAGGVLLIDYGYARAEYYRPERSGGTLLCHYRQRVHADVLLSLIHI
jgi:SAM-dependent MidA family methyltransferase